MQLLSTTANQMLVLFSFMVLGYFLNAKGILPKDTSTAISKLETIVLVPCLNFNTFYKYCTVENVLKKWNIILYGTIIVLVSVIIAALLARFFSKDLYSLAFQYDLQFGILIAVLGLIVAFKQL